MNIKNNNTVSYEGSCSSKEKKAIELGVEVITFEQLEKLLN